MQRAPEFWDRWFLGLAQYISTASKDPSTQTGAVIVRPDRSVVSVGFNGFPRGMNDADELYANREEKYSRVVHCEVNAVVLAAQSVRGCTLYTYPFASCDRCVVQMIQAGITRFVFPEPSADALTRWASAFEKTKKYIQECGLYATEVKL
jgi:dCMP deaminase